jgi:hypothetical protein
VFAGEERVADHGPEIGPADDELVRGSEQLDLSQETLLDRVRH